MVIEKTNWGEIITIPETECNSEFKYYIRSVRRINDDCKYEQALINELEQQEKRARRKFLILAYSMELFFKRIADKPHPSQEFDEWERKNKMDWNEWFHYRLSELEDEINDYSFQYANRSKHGWCL